MNSNILMHRWRCHLLLSFFIAGAFASSNLSELQSVPAQNRQLFAIPFPTPDFSGVTSMVKHASEWVVKKAKHVAAKVGHALGIDKILAMLREGKVFLKQGLSVAQLGWTTMNGLAAALAAIFANFAPIQPIFADKNGLFKLITSAANMRILVHTIEGLLNTSSLMQLLGQVLQQTSNMFGQINGFFKGILGNVTQKSRKLQTADLEPSNATVAWKSAERRLLDFTSLLSGLDFMSIFNHLQGFARNIISFSTTLETLNATFAPVLEILDPMLAGGRRLDISSIQQNQKAYAAAIKQVVPTWQGVEKLGIAMCPVVVGAQISASSLSCRVKGFIDQAGILSIVGGLVSQCDAGAMATSHSNSKCSTVAMSDNIQDLIGKNAGSLGWGLAIFGAVCGVGILGAGGAAAVVMNSQHNDEDTDEELAPAVDDDDELAPEDPSRG